MIIEAVMYRQKLGCGYNTGYGKLKIISLKLVQSIVIREPKISKNNDFVISEKKIEKAISRDFTDSLKAWESYLSNIAGQKREE